MFAKAEPLDLGNAGRTIRVENKPDYFRDNIVEFTALDGSIESGTRSASRDISFEATRANLAPLCLMVLTAPFALTALVSIARPAIQPATGHKLLINLIVGHDSSCEHPSRKKLRKMKK
ncbi:MAG: hypothetical protein PHE27_07605 [Alphaproteobacteria bacterium]|nr:hypothetical protein [Alphaproteobacteria bacterium]